MWYDLHFSLFVRFVIHVVFISFWLLCIARVRKKGEVAEQLLAAACLMLVKALDQDQQQQQQQQQEQREQSGQRARSKGRKREVTEDGAYDIFISYAHRTPAEASRLHKTLLDLDPNLKIFLDRSELKTGNIQTLERLQI